MSLLRWSVAIRRHDVLHTSAKGGARKSRAYTAAHRTRRAEAAGARPSGREAPKRPTCPGEPQDSMPHPSSPEATVPGGRVGHGVDEGDGVAFVARAARWRSPWWRSRRGGRRIAGRSRRRSTRPPAGRSFAAFRPPSGGRRFHGLCRANESRRRRFSGCDLRPNRGGTDLMIVPTKMRKQSAARGPAPARLVHYRESGISLPFRSMPSGAPGRRDTPLWRSHGRTRWSYRHMLASVRGGRRVAGMAAKRPACPGGCTLRRSIPAPVSKDNPWCCVT